MPEQIVAFPRHIGRLGNNKGKDILPQGLAAESHQKTFCVVRPSLYWGNIIKKKKKSANPEILFTKTVEKGKQFIIE